MAVIDFSHLNAPQNNTNNRANGAQTSDKPISQLWLHFGYQFDDVSEDGETKTVFITTPYGLAIDTMRDTDTSGQNEDSVSKQFARNDLLKQLQDLGGELKPGEDKIIFTNKVGPMEWVVKLRRKAAAKNIRNSDNKYVVSLVQAMAQAAAAQAAE